MKLFDTISRHDEGLPTLTDTIKNFVCPDRPIFKECLIFS